MDFGGNIVPVAAMLVPIVGSIALFSFLAVAAWSDARRKEREAYYTSETLKKIAETSGEGAKAAMDMLREQEHNSMRRRRDGQRLGGLITLAVGIGMMVFLKAVATDEPGAYLVGLIPLLIGVALLAYAYVLAPKE
jgi:Flp pilus assembly protein TadB